jgi:intermediate peptidase
VIFHEYGHVLHHVLSRSRFQHAAGARGELDFVEMPSTLFEKFLSNPEAANFLRKWALHYSDNRPIPHDVLQQHSKAKHAFAAFDMLHQAQLAQFDQLAHSTMLSGTSPEQAGAIVERAYAHLMRTTSPFHRSLPADVSPGHPYLRQLHLSTYAASYYCYLYCRMFSAAIWRRLGSGQQPSRALGEKLRERLLRWGGSRASEDILADLADISFGAASSPSFESGTVTDQHRALAAFVERELEAFVQHAGSEAEKDEIASTPMDADVEQPHVYATPPLASAATAAPSSIHT